MAIPAFSLGNRSYCDICYDRLIANLLVMATGDFWPAWLPRAMAWCGPRLLLSARSAENTAITEKKSSPRRRRLHYVMPEAAHQTWYVAVQQRADIDAAHAQVSTELHLVDWRDGCDGLNLLDKLVCDDDIRLEAVADWCVLRHDRTCDLPREDNAGLAQLVAQAFFVYGF
jgi:hypothetical protein